MATLYLLGTGAALSDPHRTTTMLAFESDGAVLVVDCGGDVVQRLMQAGLDPNAIDALIVTHEHADHVSGFPLFVEKLWLAQRRRPIPVYGIAPALAQARRAWESFDTSGWEGVPEIQWREVAHEAGAIVLEDERWRVTATPGDHSVPVIALRVADRRGGGVVAYSCDTSKSDKVTQLAQGADILVHEATGKGPSHSSATEAAEVAAAAGVGRLLLVHVPPKAHLTDEQLAEARQVFARTEKGEELGRHKF